MLPNKKKTHNILQVSSAYNPSALWRAAHLVHEAPRQQSLANLCLLKIIFKDKILAAAAA